MRRSPGSDHVERGKLHCLRVLLAYILCLLPLAAGCSSLTEKREQQDILEAELRGQERHIQELKAEVERKEGTIHGLDLEVERLQQHAAGAKPGVEPPSPGVVKEISLGRLTGGYRSNAKSRFDDSLQILIEPRDADGHSIKAPGSLHIELFEVTQAGLKVPLSAWDVTQRELRRCWDQPLLGAPSYRILIPFKALPANEKMRVIVRFTTLDGKPFEAEREFTIRLPGPGMGPMLPMGSVPGGYSVVTPGHMINGTVVGPLHGQPIPQQQVSPMMLPPPAPSGFESTGRVPEKKLETPVEPKKIAPEPQKKDSVPPPPVPIPEKPKSETVPEKKQEIIPLIPFPPREEPSAVPAKIEEKSNQPPPLPPPPVPPGLDERTSRNFEQLPAPQTLPRTSNPIMPQVQAVIQAGYESTALTAPPPSSWRQKHSPIVQMESTTEAPVKLLKPIILK